jgi:hypothetical protein
MKTAQVASVSSASQPDEESASESSTELRVRRVASSSPYGHPTTFDQPSLAPSPNPIPILGGEDEVIQVSAVRKIKVNITEPLAKSRLSHSNEASLNGSDEEYHECQSHEAQQRQQQAPMSTRIKRDPDLEGDSQSAPSDSEPMDIIEKSPYENNMDAEKGEELFMRMKNVLKEYDNGDDYRTVHEEATKIFGPTNAWCLVKANGKYMKCPITND